MKQEQTKNFENEEIKNILGRLYPGEDVNRKYHAYNFRKKRAALTIILFGIGACVCAYVSSRMQSRLQEGTHLYRNEWGEGNYEIVLSAITGSGEETVTYEVTERIYTSQELSVMQQEIIKLLPTVMLGENESLQNVRGNLYLPSKLDEYPFAIAWKSSDYKKIRTDGVVNAEAISPDGEEIILTADFSYQEYKWQQDFVVKLLSENLSPEEKRTEEIKQLLAKSDETSKEQKQMMLPDKIGAEEIIWQEKTANESIWFLVLGILGAMAAVVSMDRDLQKRDKVRKRELAEEYPEFVSKLQLYMGAGLTIRNALFRIGNDYRKEKEITGSKHFLYEEVLISCYQISNGRPEDEVYREWAKRCDEIHYRKLVFLLVSYKRQGNDNILTQLSKEVYRAWEECRNKSKKQGEEAGIKLLFPMMLMLMVVMFLILVPVYIKF